MKEARVVVLGSGAAGTAAALAAHAAGARVTVVRGRTGASALGSGALDDPGGADEGAASAAAALGIYALGPCRLATATGVLRSAAGRDLALADLAATSGPVLVARVAHPAWDGDALAASFAELDARGFVARDVGLVMRGDERSLQHVEMAALHADPARLARAAERVREALAAGGSFAAVLLPPWLGVERPRASDLSALAGVPCGEVLAPIDGPAGVRFERARDRCLQSAHIDARDGWARRVVESDAGCGVLLEDETFLECEALVLATGGLLAGGIDYTPGDAARARAVPPPSRAPFALGYESPVSLGRDGHRLVVPGSVFGVAPESLAWPFEDAPALERVGVLVDSRFRATARILACGDAIEGRPRTMLAALASGAAAGRAAAAT